MYPTMKEQLARWKESLEFKKTGRGKAGGIGLNFNGVPLVGGLLGSLKIGP